MKSYEEPLLVDASNQALRRRRTVRLRLTGASCITPTHWSLQHHPDSLGHHHPDSLGHHRRQFRLTENYADTGSDSLEPAAILRLTGACNIVPTHWDNTTPIHWGITAAQSSDSTSL
ncbi:hypothetical protein PYW07_014048 [Mythimna separata]|uniref:Uncharacterized protein n=1 Tax=Mythimna separata TaxID=271217 RepID=A0AAD7YFW9_MYTSE|nr:hypothetical protein PYW07_014048 [Mythimna separata]